MPDTTPLAPTDAELMQVIREAAFDSTTRRDGLTSLRIARAVLAKWGNPAPASSGGKSTKELCAAVCESRAASLSRDGSHAASNEARKCAASIRVCVISPAAQQRAALAASDGMEPVARIEGIDEYGPRIEWRRHWVDAGVGARLFTATQVQAMLAKEQAARKTAQQQLEECKTELTKLEKYRAMLDQRVVECESPVQQTQNSSVPALQLASYALNVIRIFWQHHTLADALSMTMAELHSDVERIMRAMQQAADALDWLPTSAQSRPLWDRQQLALSALRKALEAAPSRPALAPLTTEQLSKELMALSGLLFDARIGQACSSCEAGTYQADSNGYSQFHRCNKCRYVPMWGEDGREFGITAAKKGGQHAE